MKDQLTVTNDRLAPDHEMPDSHRPPRWRLVCRLVLERMRVKDHDVGIRPHGKGALVHTSAEGGREHAGREQARAIVHVGPRLDRGVHQLLGAVHAGIGSEFHKIPHVRIRGHTARCSEPRTRRYSWIPVPGA